MKNNLKNEIYAEYVNETDWYRFDINTLCRKLGTDKEKGLSDDAVKAKRAAQGKNDIFPYAEEEKDNAPKTAFSVLSVLLIICLSLSGFLLNDMTALPAVILTVLGYVAVLLMFFYSKRNTASLAQYSIPNVRVIRDGEMYPVSQTKIVQGDLIYLSEGDLVRSSDSLQDVVEKFRVGNRYNLVVVDDEDNYLGFISRANTFSAYRRFISDTSDE